MVFIGRREDASIYGLWTVQQWEGQEQLPDNHADVVAFRAAVEFVPATPEQKLAATGLTIGELKQLLGLE